MSILRISEFQKAYPKLWDKINETRIETGSEHLLKSYTEDYAIPIRMYDAALAEGFLEKNNVDEPVTSLGFKIVGYNNLSKILDAVKTEPNMNLWSDIIYYKDNPKGLFTDRYKENSNFKKSKKQTKKEPTMAKIRNKVDGEIIVNVETIVDAETAKATFTAVGLDGTDYTAEINQKKLKYAFENKGVVRGRTNAAGERVWRVVKQKFIKDEPVEDNPELPATE
jgi:hypothetical protein